VLAPELFRQQLISAMPRLRRYARSLVLDAGGADDLVQIALERALERWQQYDPQRELLLWLLSIAHNAFLDLRRREARFTVVDPQEAGARQDALGGDPGVDIGLRIDLMAALGKLSPEHREPLLLVTLEQLSYAECSELLGIPIGTVMSRISRARVALRAALDGRPARANAPVLRRVV
jgi:RNA polymerase sigma-70 factor (ECF subfamily)